MAWYGMVWYGMLWYMALYGIVWYDRVWICGHAESTNLQAILHSVKINV